MSLIQDLTFFKTNWILSKNYIFIFRTVYITLYNLNGNDGLYKTHPIFVYPKMLYLVVFDCQKCMESSLTSVMEWTKAIRSKSASSPIILTGIHDKLFTKYGLIFLNIYEKIDFF